jgi:magnesium transporter
VEISGLIQGAAYLALHPILFSSGAHMIRSLYFSNGQFRTDLEVEEFSKALQDPQGLLWVDFEETPSETDEPILRKVFGFHPLAVDDALQETHVPKLDDWGKYLYIVLQALNFIRDDCRLDSSELDVFLGKNYIVTHHDLPIRAVRRVWESCQRDERYLQMDADHFLYKLIDELVVDYMTTVEDMDEEIETVEDQVFDKPTPEIVQRLFSLKRASLHLRRALSPLREVLNKLARDNFEVVDAKDRIYFRDIYDHLVRLHDISESLRDLVGGALDTYLSVINNRMNDIMKTLTVITTLFMPISFIAGFFGMNFFQPVSAPLANWTRILPFIISSMIMILLPASMLIWIRRRGWL